jgi:catechol 2,3-dioxygenase-like lactoylglutathione lyase family enzyme
VPHLHHVNLGVPTGGTDAQSSFLIDVLGFRRVEPGPEMTAFGALWFDNDEGVQIHLSVDPEHRAADMAHVALDIDDLSSLETRLQMAGVEFTANDFGGGRLVFCRDPAGNRWELRGGALVAG